ncbi:MAG: nuclear transport factor 2 family protein [Candidatus Acidiferrum sp.]
MWRIRMVIALIPLIAVIPARTQTKDASDIDAVKQVEQTMESAMVAGDVDKLKQIYADNFATIGSDGKLFTKETLLTDFASFHDKLKWFENGPIDVQVFGDVALAQGSVKEKRSRNGKDTSGQFLWQDVLLRRAGKWVVWRTAAARVVLAHAPNAQSQDPAVVAAIKKFENDLGDAMVANNIGKIDLAYADDWATLASSGEKFTKEGLLEDFKSGNHKLMAFENGPTNVQVLGDVALVQTSVTENRIQDGKDISGQFVFMDLLKKRAGQWVIVRTLATKPG